MDAKIFFITLAVEDLGRSLASRRRHADRTAHMRPFGVYSGYFADPDGHLFEIAWNTAQ